MVSRRARVELAPGSSLLGRETGVPGNPRTVYAFLGVPYAAPPIGKNRFLPPRPYGRLWQGEREATEFGPICPQNVKNSKRTHHPFLFPEKISEDCLYLNIWTPHIPPRGLNATLMPVIFWIHGGAFAEGFSDMYTGRALCSHHPVVFISINYRLGALGFLSTGDAHAPGNAGLLDQVEALRWVQKYVRYFGGDPGNVTIAGESAGGFSVDFHMLSDVSHGLFRRAISQSGVSPYPGSVHTWKKLGDFVKRKAVQLGCSSRSSEDVLDFLRAMPAEELNAAFPSVIVPTIDGSFIKDFPQRLYAQGKLSPADYIIGFNSDEGMLLTRMVFTGLGVELEINDDNVKEYMKMVAKYGTRNHVEVAEAAMKEYFDVRPGDSEGYLRAMTDFYGDKLFKIPCIQAANSRKEGSNTYVYCLSHRMSFAPKSRPQWAKADHADDMTFLFGPTFLEPIPDIFTEEERKLHLDMMAYWVNFATTGNPNGSGLSEWPKYNARDKKYLVLKPSPEVASDYRPDRVKFWTETVHALENKPSLNSKY